MCRSSATNILLHLGMLGKAFVLKKTSLYSATTVARAIDNENQ